MTGEDPRDLLDRTAFIVGMATVNGGKNLTP
jgi:hypothetical protein